MKLTNHVYKGANGRASLIDFQEPDGYDYENIVVFIHGYKGYKDWGAWNLVQSYFVSSGMAFCKFNMSHNGGTIEEPIDFKDLEAFSLNRYSYELEDVQHVLDWLAEKVNISNKRIHLIGHSRGGGVSILAASDQRVTSVITWASISDIGSRFPEGAPLNKWKERGFYTVKNTRTNQDMPHKFALYEDWLEHKTALNIEEKAKNIRIPVLHIHGDNDDSVSITESEALSLWTKGKLIIINGANHTFNTHQPYEEEEMPNKLHEACVLTLQFIETQGSD
jgi:dipeptidyl aminopeptidase/acylaminoacyl peptidase